MCDSSAIRRWACSNLAVLSFKESGSKRCVGSFEDIDGKFPSKLTEIDPPPPGRSQGAEIELRAAMRWACYKRETYKCAMTVLWLRHSSGSPGLRKSEVHATDWLRQRLARLGSHACGGSTIGGEVGCTHATRQRDSMSPRATVRVFRIYKRTHRTGWRRGATSSQTVTRKTPHKISTTHATQAPFGFPSVPPPTRGSWL